MRLAELTTGDEDIFADQLGGAEDGEPLAVDKDRLAIQATSSRGLAGRRIDSNLRAKDQRPRRSQVNEDSLCLDSGRGLSGLTNREADGALGVERANGAQGEGPGLALGRPEDCVARAQLELLLGLEPQPGLNPAVDGDELPALTSAFAAELGALLS